MAIRPIVILGNPVLHTPTAPVPVGSRVRGRFKLNTYETIEGGAQITFDVTMEREGSDKPVCVAESVSRRYV